MKRCRLDKLQRRRFGERLRERSVFFWLLGNPDFGFVTSCCLRKTPAFGFEDQSAPFVTLEVALDSYRKYLSSQTNFGGCRWLEKNHEVAAFIRAFRGCRFCAGRELLRSFEEYDLGFPGYPAGRGADPARGAPGGG
ncbi:hypothetical protein F511_04096 [Dorcoceras hygrometricum]|uniref:Uncharacterized protein n=1 Tax=Dorcoceras hygrometricum TaxID=472368 RepID=A0A2Z7D6W7_9LAMI|nr:hypothetical protein F511_04096 [Dorcoceras hygrometricum]